jgi:hypothetical protein
MALKEYASENAKNDPWTIVAPHCLQDWSRRGHAGAGDLSEEQSKCLIRVDGLNGDETNGFFVCYLERRSLAEKTDTLPQKAVIDVSQKLDLPLYEGQFKQAPPKATKPKPTKKAASAPSKKKLESPAVSSTNEKKTEEKVYKKTEEKVYGKRNKAKALAKANEQYTNEKKEDKNVVGKSEKAKERPKRKGTDPSKFNKKREKKLAWKLKQKEMKGKRVEKKAKPADEKETK